MSPLCELAGHEVVFGVEARQTGKVSEAGVRGEDEDEHGAGLQRVEQEVAETAGAVDEFSDLADDGRGAAHIRRGMDVRGEDR